MHLPRLLLALAAPVFIGIGCTPPAPVAALNPQPRVNIERHKESMALALDPAVLDLFVVPKSNVYASDMNVTQWHTTLGSAFANGFSPYFATSAGKPDMTLRLAKTEIFFDDKDSGAIQVTTNRGSAEATQVRIACNILYQAYLEDADGKVIRKDLDTVRYDGNTWNRSELLEGAVAKMFEQIGKKLFQDTADHP